MSAPDRSAAAPSKALRSVLTAVAFVAVAGCSGGEPSGPSSGGPTAPSSITSNSPSNPRAAGTTPPTPTASSTRSPRPASLIDAGATAQHAVSGSTLTSIETDRTGALWEIKVSTSDGTEHELQVSADGTTVLRGPSAKQESASDKAGHRARIRAAELDYQDAAQKITAAIANGRITELDLDGYRGTTVWEADVRAPSGAKHEIKIDAASGTVLADTTDG